MNYLGVGVVVGCVAYSLVLHFTVLQGEKNGLQVLLVLLPLLLWVCWMALRAVSATWRPAVIVSFAALAYTLVAGQHAWLGLIAADGMWHASMNAFMLWLFGRTLLPGRLPLISQVARHLNDGELTPAVAAYTRRVTLAWSLFFAAQLLGSALLYLFAPLAAWSLFVNVLNTPLIALMFAAEYLVRLLLHPDQARNSIPQVIGAFTRHFAAPRKD